jgi:hypothetical protein
MSIHSMWLAFIRSNVLNNAKLFSKARTMSGYPGNSLFRFQKGKLDIDESEREARLAFDLLEPVDILSGNALEGVIIEALEVFLRERKNRRG